MLAAGTPATVQAELRALVFSQAPSSHLNTVITGVTLEVSDGIDPPVSNNNVIIQALPIGVKPVPGNPNAFTSTSTSSQTNTVTTPVAVANPTSSTTITAVLNGTQTVYSQTFALPYSDPTVQAAIAQADMALANDGAVAGAPALASSTTTNQGSQTTTVTTGQSSAQSIGVTTNFGPGTLSSIGPADASSLMLFAGEEDTDVDTLTTTTVDQTATTTTTTLTAQTYTIAGTTSAPVIAGTVANQPVSDEATIDPFASVAITDATPGQTETVTITPGNVANGTLSDPNAATDGSTLTGGAYTVSGTAAQVSADVDALVFTPTVHQVAPGQTVTTGFTIADTDTAGASATDSTTTVVATAADTPPVIAGTQDYAIDQQETLQPFPGVTITDPDLAASETTTITLEGPYGPAPGYGFVPTDADGTLSGAGLTKTGVGTYQLAAASPAAEQAALQALVFTPTAMNSVTTVALQVSDGLAPPVTDPNTDIVVFDSPLDANGPVLLDHNPGGATLLTSSSTPQTDTVATPVSQTNAVYSTTIDAVINGDQTVYDQTFALPYSDPTVQAAVAGADADLAADGVTPTSPSLTSSQVTDQGTTTTTVQTGQTTSAPVTTETETFGPALVGPGVFAAGTAPPAAPSYFYVESGQEDIDVNTAPTTTIDQTVTTTTTTLTAETYTIAGSISAPVISGALADQPVSDEATIDPFASVAITDPTPGQFETATVTPSTGANGTLSDPNAATDGSTLTGGALTVTGTAAQVSADLDALVFTPAAHQVAPGGTVTTGFTIADTDTSGQSATDGTTSVVATAAEDAPVIAGTYTTPIVVNATQTAQPFTAATITDPDFGATETTTITLNSAGTPGSADMPGSAGAPTDANGTLAGAGLTKTGTGTYQLAAASPAAETSALQALVFTPAADTGSPNVTTGLTLQVSDGIAPPVTDTNTVVQNESGSYVVTTSSTNETVTDTTPVAQTIATASTTITAVLNGTQVLYSQTFALPFSDPAVQAAVAQADADLVQAGATPGAPGLASSQVTNQGTQTTTTQTGIQVGTPTVTQVVSFGPATVHYGPSDSLTLNLLPGQEDLNINTDTVTTVDQTVTTTATQLTTQAYTIAGSVGAPVISGTVAGQAVSDATSLDPFAQVVVTDPNAGQTETVTVTPGSTANGTLSDPNAAADGSSVAAGVITLSGTAAQVSADLDALVFTPTAHQVAPGATVTTGFAIADTDTSGQSASDATTSVVATAAPVSGGPTPFADLTVGSPVAGDMVTVTVGVLPSISGTFGAGFGGTVDAAGTLYGFTGSVAAAV